MANLLDNILAADPVYFWPHTQSIRLIDLPPGKVFFTPNEFIYLAKKLSEEKQPFMIRGCPQKFVIELINKNITWGKAFQESGDLLMVDS